MIYYITVEFPLVDTPPMWTLLLNLTIAEWGLF